MIPAFWDTSAFLPLCIDQKPSLLCQQLLQQYSLVVWWGTSVEAHSALERLLRMSQISREQYDTGAIRLAALKDGWQEIRPSKTLRSSAESLLSQHTLKAGDALQLAAALTWSGPDSSGKIFVSGDQQLLRAAQQAGFQTIAAL